MTLFNSTYDGLRTVTTQWRRIVFPGRNWASWNGITKALFFAGCEVVTSVSIKQCFSTAGPRLGTGPSSYEKSIYQARVWQKLRTAVIKGSIFCVITSVNVNSRIRGKYCPHHQGGRLSHVWYLSGSDSEQCLAYFQPRNGGSIFSDTSVSF
jgi:hypothetical protein